MDLDKKVFGNKKFSDILKEIYDNQQKKSNQINGLINELKPLINEIGDATLLVPLIRDYLDMGIRNDDLLIKMATIIQRAFTTNDNTDNSIGISEKEKEELLKLMEEAKEENKNED